MPVAERPVYVEPRHDRSSTRSGAHRLIPISQCDQRGRASPPPARPAMTWGMRRVAMRDGDLGAGLFCGVIGAVLILFVLGLERGCRYLWRRASGRRPDDPESP